MAFKIDPDAAPLYKEIKSVHAAFKKAIKQQPAVHILRVLTSVFGSSTYRCEVRDNNSNTHEDITWQSPILARSIGAVFNASLTVHLDDDANATSADMQDQWLYGALLPLGLKLELHESWKEVLLHTVELIAQPAQPQYPLFNAWDEKTLTEHLGWLPDEDNSAQISEVTEHQAEVARCVMKALHTDPVAAGHAWPNIAPWLHAMQVLSAPPEDALALESLGNRTVDWAPWSSNLQKMFLTSSAHSLIDLPAEFSAADSDVAPSSV